MCNYKDYWIQIKNLFTYKQKERYKIYLKVQMLNFVSVSINKPFNGLL